MGFVGPYRTEKKKPINASNSVTKIPEGKRRFRITDLIWLRNHVVAPLSEEITCTACMLPLLLQCF
jgi:hypothetical protein